GERLVVFVTGNPVYNNVTITYRAIQHKPEVITLTPNKPVTMSKDTTFLFSTEDAIPSMTLEFTSGDGLINLSKVTPSSSKVGINCDDKILCHLNSLAEENFEAQVSLLSTSATIEWKVPELKELVMNEPVVLSGIKGQDSTFVLRVPNEESQVTLIDSIGDADLFIQNVNYSSNSFSGSCSSATPDNDELCKISGSTNDTKLVTVRGFTDYKAVLKLEPLSVTTKQDDPQDSSGGSSYLLFLLLSCFLSVRGRVNSK
ncbi:hypothetical protein, partial [Veronia pacifica]